MVGSLAPWLMESHARRDGCRRSTKKAKSWSASVSMRCSDSRDHMYVADMSIRGWGGLVCG
jgi:hypothetical protein